MKTLGFTKDKEMVVWAAHPVVHASLGDVNQAIYSDK